MINEHIFDIIDTKEKAYWFGFLYADGSITKNRLSFCQSTKRIHAIKSFCNFINISFDLVYYNISDFPYTTKDGIYKVSISELAYISFNNAHLCNMLKLHGLIPNKSKVKILPILSSEELYLAFLLGYYDGNGNRNSTVISSGSLNFLNDIKQYFNLEADPSIKYNPAGSVYIFSLGHKLFYKMINNYEGVLPEKRQIHLRDCYCKKCNKQLKGRSDYCVKCFQQTNSKYKLINIQQTNKEEIQKLQELVNSKSLNEVGRIYGVTDNAIRKRCKKLGITIPKREPGYWAKVNQKELNVSKEELQELIKTHSNYALSKKFNLSSHIIDRKMKEYGLEYPDINWSSINMNKIWEHRRNDLS